jgi:hypothetical protein
MTVSWIITEGALFDYSYSWTGHGNAAMFANSQSVRVTTSFFFGPTTYSTDQTTTGTLYTSTIRTSQTTAKTTTTAFVTDLPSVWVEYPEEALIYATRPSASWNNAASTIATFAASTTATITRTTQVTTSLLSTTSAATFLEPVPYIPAGLGWGYSGFCPTVYAWTSAAGWQQEEISDSATRPVTEAQLAFSGRATVYPHDEYYQVASASGNSGFSFATATWQSQALSWTRQTTTAATSSRASGGGASPITRSTQTYTKSIHTTQSSSALFLANDTHRQLTINGSNVPNTLTQSVWWASTELVQTTYADDSTTRGGSTTTTKAASTVATRGDSPLIAGASAQIAALSFFEGPRRLRGVLQFGKYNQFATHNAGFATNTTQAGGAAISHASQSFVLPPQSFSTAMLQRGITAPIPNQTRSRTSSNSTTSWSLGAGALTITTSSTNSTTFGTTTSSYDLAVDSNTLWTSGSSGLDVQGFTQTYYLAYLAAGGGFPTQSFFKGGGLFTATQGTNEFTGSALTGGSAVTAIAPLPHFEARFFPLLLTPDQPIGTSNFYFPAGLQTLGFPLTA